MRDNDKARKSILIRNLVIVAIVAVVGAALVLGQAKAHVKSAVLANPR